MCVPGTHLAYPEVPVASLAFSMPSFPRSPPGSAQSAGHSGEDLHVCLRPPPMPRFHTQGPWRAAFVSSWWNSLWEELAGALGRLGSNSSRSSLLSAFIEAVML